MLKSNGDSLIDQRCGNQKKGYWITATERNVKKKRQQERCDLADRQFMLGKKLTKTRQKNWQSQRKTMMTFCVNKFLVL